MNYEELIKNGYNITIPNPKYNARSRKNKQPKTIDVPYYGPRGEGFAVGGMKDNISERWSIPNEDIEKYTKHSITYNPYDNTLDDQLAEKQSTFEQIRNSFAQTLVSEIGAGTLRGAVDLVDWLTHEAISNDEDNDYSSEASRAIQKWQEEFERDHEIYLRQGEDISNGGLLDFSWYLKNMPTIASSLTLLIPSTGVMKGLAYLGKATKATKAIGNTRRFLTGINKVRKAANEGRELNILQQASKTLNSKRVVDATNTAFNLGGNAFLSRIMENYQESAQTYDEMLPEATETLKGMSNEEYKAFLERNNDILNDVDTKDKEAVARRIAKESADRTFRDDMINGVFDVWQLYALRNLKHFMNGPMRASVRRAHLNTLRFPGKTPEEIEALLSKDSFWKKAKTKIGDLAWGSKLALTAQLNEGVEEAVNYIAQQEGLTYGKLLLGKEGVTSFWDQRLANYMKAPALWESAFWGLMGGITFQHGASGLARLQNAINTYNEEKEYQTDDKTKETKKKTKWRDLFVLPEVKGRTEDINRRAHAESEVRAMLKQVKDGIDPFQKGRKLETEEEKEAVREEIFNKRTVDLLLHSMFVGNYNLTKAYLSNDKVMQAFVDAKIITQAEAERRKKEIDETATRLEELYDDNMAAIENAIGEKTRNGVRFEDVPIEYMQILAEMNIRHQLNADTYTRRIQQYENVASSEEHRLEKELEEKGVNYREALKVFTLITQISQLTASINAIKNRKENDTSIPDPRFISGQTAIKSIENQRRVLIDMLNDDSSAKNFEFNNLTKIITALRYGSATESKGLTDFAQNVKSERYIQTDAAITNAFESDESNFNTRLDSLKAIAKEFGIDEKTFDGVTLEKYQESAQSADVLAEKLADVLGESGTAEELSNLSKALLTAYSNLAFYETQRAIELSQIAKDKDSVIEAAHEQHNMMKQEIRGPFIDGIALNLLKDIAKRYTNEEHPEDNILDALAYGAVNKEAREKLKRVLSEEDMKLYDDAMEMMALNDRKVTSKRRKNGDTAMQNALLPELIQRALWRSSYEKFAEVRDPKEVIDTLTEEAEKAVKEDEEETKESEETSSKSEKPSESKETKKTDTTSSEPSESSDEAKKGKKIDFTINKAGNKIESRATLVFDDSGNLVRVANYDSSDDSGDARMVAVDADTNTWELDVMGDVSNSMTSMNHSMFGTSLFNKIQPISDGAVVTKNPTIVINDDGTIVEVTPGEIDIPTEDKKAESSISSTGEVESSDEPPVEDDESGETTYEDEVFQKIQWAEDEGYTDYLFPIINAAVRVWNSGEKIETKEELIKKVRDIIREPGNKFAENLVTELTDEEFTSVFNALLPKVNENLEEAEVGFTIKELGNILEVADLSSKTDEQLAKEGEAAHKAALHKAFEKVINDYATHAVIAEETQGDVTKKVISIENLMRYMINVTGNYAIANALYDDAIKFLEGKYIVVEGKKKYEKDVILSRASTNASDALDKRFNGRSLDLRRVADKTNKEAEDAFYNIVYNLRPDDNLAVAREVSYDRNGNESVTIKFMAKGKTISILPVPWFRNGTHFTMIRKGWIYDIPASANTESTFKRLLTNIIVNPSNDNGYKTLQEIVKKLVYTPSIIEDKDVAVGEKVKRIQNPKYLDLVVDFFKTLQTTGNDIKSFVPSFIDIENGIPTDANQAIMLASHIANIYRDIRSNDTKYLSANKLDPDTYEDIIKDIRAQSLENWFAKMEDSDRSIFYLSEQLRNGKKVDVKVDTINEGALRIIPASDRIPINNEEAIAPKHRDKLHIGVSSITERGIMYSTSPDHNRTETNSKPGSTFVTIERNDGRLVEIHAYPRSITDLSKENKVIADIKNDIRRRLRSILQKWGSTTSDTYDNTKALSLFLNTMFLNTKDTVALFRGVTIDPAKGNLNNGIKIGIRQQDGSVKYVFLWNENRDGNAHRLIDFAKGDRVNCLNAEKRKEGVNRLIDMITDALTFNIAFSYVRGDVNTNGFGRIDAEGHFIIKIATKEYTFDSYRDFIINNGIVSVTTKHDGVSNFIRLDETANQFERPVITYKIEGYSTTPVERRRTVRVIDTITPEANKETADKIKTAIQANPNIGRGIFPVLLKDSRLSILTKSVFFKALDFSRIYYKAKINPDAKDVESDAIASTARISASDGSYKKGDIFVGDNFFKLIEDGNQEEAFRHLLHEVLHRTLQNVDQKRKDKLFDELRSVYNAFIAASDTSDNLVSFLLYNSSARDRAKYYTDGELNNRGLEEFLIESLTRPELMRRLNDIPTGKKLGDKLNTKKSSNLLRDLLLKLAEFFGIDINKGSLLEKEYNLFKSIGNVTLENTETETEEETINNEQESETSKEDEEEITYAGITANPVDTAKQENEDEDEDDYADESAATDAAIANAGHVLDTIPSQNLITFMRLLNNGGIQIIC